MGIDGFVDIEPILNKSRINGDINDGPAVAEAHAELNAAISEIFGIEMGQQISESIFGDVDSDGSWTMARFSRQGSASSGESAVGWEFSDGIRRVRLCQVSGDIQIWEFTNGVWEQVINIEAEPEYNLTDLADVQIPSLTSGLTLKVQGGQFVLGTDTTQNGATTFEALTDVNTWPYPGAGPMGCVWMTDGTDDINYHVLPGKTMVAQYYESNAQLIEERGQSEWISGWRTPRYASSDYTRVSIVDGTKFVLDSPGVYKVIFGYRQTSGPTWVLPTEGQATSQSRLVIGLGSSKAKMWPPQFQGSLVDDPWWAFDTDTTGSLQLADSKATGLFDDKTFFVVSAGGPTAFFQLSLFYSVKGGSRIFDFRVSIERIS